MSVLVLVFAKSFEVVVVFVDSIALWILLGLAQDWLNKVENKQDKLRHLFKQPLAYFGMMLGHLGIAISMTGVVVTVYFSEEKDVRMDPGEVVMLAGYEFRLNKVVKVKGPNYVADQGEIDVLKQGKKIITLYPEKRQYRASGNIMTESDMDAGIFRDLYVALGEPVGDGAWAVRIHYKPFVRWIWFGGLIIAAGGILSIVDRRYRLRQRRMQSQAAAGVMA